MSQELTPDFLSSLNELSAATLGAPVANGTSIQANSIHVCKLWTANYERHFALFAYDVTELPDGDWELQLFVGNRGENIESDVDTKEDSFVPSEESIAPYKEQWMQEFNELKGKNHVRRKLSEWMLALDDKVPTSQWEVCLTIPMS